MFKVGDRVVVKDCQDWNGIEGVIIDTAAESFGGEEVVKVLPNSDARHESGKKLLEHYYIHGFRAYKRQLAKLEIPKPILDPNRFDDFKDFGIF